MAPTYRPFGKDDLETVARVFAATLNDLLMEAGGQPYVDLDDAEAWQRAWNGDRRSLFEHIDSTDSESWLAEDGGVAVGYARSILREGMCQLTEFFVLPAYQSAGIGRELISRAFDDVEAAARTIIATTRPTALARYLKSGVFPQSLVGDLERKPEPFDFRSDLAFQPLAGTESDLAALDAIDADVLGYRRRIDHRWLIGDRAGFLYLRKGQPLGYGYIGRYAGPFALRDPKDFPAVLAHAENEAAAQDLDYLTLMLPLANQAATRYLLNRGFRFDEGFMMVYMTDKPGPKLDRYLCTMPGFFA